MPTDELITGRRNASAGIRCTDEQISGLFAVDAVEREKAVAQLAAQGAAVIPLLLGVALRPLDGALGRWPEWQRMLPATAIMTRCALGRQAAVQSLVEIGGPAVPALSRLLQSRDPALRQASAEGLARMGGQEAVAILHTLLHEERILNRRRHRVRNVVRVLAGCAAASIGFLLLYAFHSDAERRFTLPALAGIVVWIGMGFAEDKTVGLRRAAVRALSKHGSKRHIGTLTMCLADADTAVRTAVSQGLVRLLPLLRPEDREQFATDEINTLLAALDGRDEGLAVAVLAAMQQIGDDMRVLNRVAYLIDSPVHYEVVREAAWQCLPHVKQRIKDTAQVQALLRPAGCGEADAPTLLRAVSEDSNSTVETQLLRAH